MKPALERRKRVRRMSGVITVAMFSVLVLLSSPIASAQPVQVELIKPRLEIPIPNVTFSGVTLNLIGEYFSGIYKYLLSVVGIFATVMMMVGGFQYLTAGGDKNRADGGRKRIMNALAGLILAFGSYAMLYVINPALVQFQSLQLTSVVPETEFDSTLGYTEEDTSEYGEVSTAGNHPPTTAACPFTLTEAKGSKAAKLEFYRHVQSNDVAWGFGKRTRVTRIADVADACDVNLGSCGATAGAINALAGVGDTKCLVTATSCNDDSKGPEMFAISGRQRRELYGRNCALWTPEKAEKTRKTLISVWRKYTTDSVAKAAEVQAGCKDGKGATDKVRQYLEDEAKAGRLPADWPKSWAAKLQPGDRLVIYNGNNDLVGAHAVIFMGWESPGKMQVVQGGNGGPGNQKNVTRPGSTCITPECGPNYRPLVNGWSPD